MLLRTKEDVTKKKMFKLNGLVTERIKHVCSHYKIQKIW